MDGACGMTKKRVILGDTKGVLGRNLDKEDFKEVLYYVLYYYIVLCSILYSLFVASL